MVATAGPRGSHKSHAEDAFAQYKFISQPINTLNTLSYIMDFNPTSHSTSPTVSTDSKPTTKTLKVTYLMLILLINPTTAHPTISKSDSSSPNSISPNPNQRKTGNLQVGTHGTVSIECDQDPDCLTRL